MFGIAAIVLFILAAIIEFGKLSGINALGLAFLGLACLALHLFTAGVWPLPWRARR